MRSTTTVAILCLMAFPLLSQDRNSSKRPMTFLDIVGMRSVGNPAVSPDGRWILHTLSAPDWKTGKSFTDIYLVSLERGVGSSSQMTFTKDKNETAPQWARDSRLFAFASNREASESKSSQNQLYVMRPDGGEAMKVSEAKDGVGTFAFTKDGKWLVFLAGKEDERQLWAIAVSDIGKEKPKQLTKHEASIVSWQISPDSKRLYFTSPDSLDKANRDRKEKKFDARVRNEAAPPNHLWAFDLDSNKQRKLSAGNDYTVSDITISFDSKWVGFRGTSSDRYKRTVTESSNYSDLYLLEVASGSIERLTNNEDISESSLRFSPDNSMIAFSASDEFQYFRNGRIYVRQTTPKGGQWKKLGDGFDGDLSIGFWSRDGKMIYFNEGLGATNQLFSVSMETGKVTQLTDEKGVVFATQDEDTKVVIVNYTDPKNPFDLHFVPRMDRIQHRNSWRRLTSANPQADEFLLGSVEAVRWKSTDGKMVEGVLVMPVNFEKGKLYPLVVQIHGGPAGVSLLGFNSSYNYYCHVYAAAGYACLLPNYRGSINYGEMFKMEISGDYFRQGYEDIMAGVDHLIANGLVDADKMGVMGWSAGGHWSNWILTHTDRFKAISSGAGTMNWISMYAQSDIQRNREFYYQGKPYDHFEHYWDVSPLKYIKNAKTPTLIHVVDGDPRVPRPQSEELHMALKMLGVPTEFFVYPGTTHGIPDARNQMVKMVSEFNWMEKWIRGKEGWFEWNELLSTLKEEKDDKKEVVSDKE
ncbi:MAG: S9 family peptidase [Ignavibacteriales bacterium]|nr:S9 family peptidase [Ignavibacteriales bacterium]